MLSVVVDSFSSKIYQYINIWISTGWTKKKGVLRTPFFLVHPVDILYLNTCSKLSQPHLSVSAVLRDRDNKHDKHPINENKWSSGQHLTAAVWWRRWKCCVNGHSSFIIMDILWSQRGHFFTIFADKQTKACINCKNNIA